MLKSFLDLLTRKDHTGLQFMKYVFCGGMATVVDMLVFYLLATLLLLALNADDMIAKLWGIKIQFIADTVRARNFATNSTIAFGCSNSVAYIMNIFFVFDSEPSKRHKELAFFFAISGFSIVVGIFVGWLLIQIGYSTIVSYIVKVVCCLVVNYFGRKFFVFAKVRQIKV